MKILKTIKYAQLSVKVFYGDCVTGLENEYFQDRVAFDATDLAQLVENGQEINEQQFASMVEPSYKTIRSLEGNYTYYYNRDRDVAWFDDEDIEYFYA